MELQGSELLVSVSPFFLAITAQEVGPTRQQVASDVLSDDADGVSVLIEGFVEFFVRDLVDSPIG